MTDYPTLALGELADPQRAAIAIGPFGSRMKAEIYVDAGVPVIRGTNISTDRSLKGDWVYVTEEFARTIPGCALQQGDLVFPHRGSIGEVALVDAQHSPMVLSSSMMKFRPDRRRVDPRFLYYYFKSDRGRDEILRFGSQVGTPGIGQPLASLRQFLVPFPPLDRQVAIADILSALDDKIELNRRTNETLEDIAEAIFSDWFVEFGPVRRKQAGATDPIEIMGRLTPDPSRAANLAGLFSDRLDNLDLPESWTERAIGDLVDIAGGSTPSTADDTLWQPAEHRWATPKDLSGMNDLALFDTDRRISSAGLAKITSGLLPAGTVLLSSRAPIGYLAIAQAPVAINQGFIALKTSPDFGSAYLYLWCKANMEQIHANANGSTFQEISKKNFRPITTALPNSLKVTRAFEEIAKPLIDRIVCAAAESRTLAETRDYLLPKLMSGQVRIKAGTIGQGS